MKESVHQCAPTNKSVVTFISQHRRMIDVEGLSGECNSSIKVIDARPSIYWDSAWTRLSGRQEGSRNENPQMALKHLGTSVIDQHRVVYILPR